MKEQEEEPIDLDSLKPRELLIVLAKDVREMKGDMRKMEKSQQDIQLKVNTLETKSKINGGFAGFFAGLLTILLERLIR
jgi:hypothetical protein